MNENKTKLILALQQVNNLTSLLSGNQWEKFLYSHLIPIEVELQRQLSIENNKEFSTGLRKTIGEIVEKPVEKEMVKKI